MESIFASFTSPRADSKKAFTELDCTNSGIDSLLLPYFHAANADAARTQLDSLIHTHADPIIWAAIRRCHFGNTAILPGDPTAAEVRAETIARLILRLTKAGDTLPPITDFLAYTKFVANATCWEFARKSQREKPFSAFMKRSGSDTPHDPEAFSNADLLGAVASVENKVAWREQIREIWLEICQLPAKQRAAILLHLRGPHGHSLTSYFGALCGADASQIASALNVPFNELSEMLEHLPMNDAQIGKHLELSAREVASLRLTGRRRLQRRVRAWHCP